MSDKKIESCKFYGGHSDSVVFVKSILPNDSSTFIWEKPKLVGDGGFSIKTNNIERTFGYYSNGGIINDKYTLRVYNDTIR